MFTVHAILNWLYHYTGSVGSGSWYGFWSGFGSDIGEVTILSAILGIYHHHKCATCFRFGRHILEDTKQKVCSKHYTHDCVDQIKSNHQLRYPHHIAHTKIEFNKGKEETAT